MCPDPARGRHLALLLCTAVLLTGQSQAHQQWLAPNLFVTDAEPVWITFDHTFSDRRFQPGSSPGAYYQWWVVSPDGVSQSVPSLFLGKTRTVGEIELQAPGTYRLEGVEASMPWTQLRIDGEERWQPGSRAEHVGSDIIVSRRYFSKALAYVSMGAPSATTTHATKDPLEITFDAHPNTLKSKEAFSVTVLSYGQVVSNQPVALYPERGSAHDDATVECRTDSQGRCSLNAPQPGRVILTTEAKGELDDDTTVDGYVHRVSVMLELADPNVSG